MFPEMIGPMKRPRKYPVLDEQKQPSVAGLDKTLKGPETAYLQVNAGPEAALVQEEEIGDHLHHQTLTGRCGKTI